MTAKGIFSRNFYIKVRRFTNSRRNFDLLLLMHLYVMSNFIRLMHLGIIFIYRDDTFPPLVYDCFVNSCSRLNT